MPKIRGVLGLIVKKSTDKSFLLSLYKKFSPHTASHSFSSFESLPFAKLVRTSRVHVNFGAKLGICSMGWVWGMGFTLGALYCVVGKLGALFCSPYRMGPSSDPSGPKPVSFYHPFFFLSMDVSEKTQIESPNPSPAIPLQISIGKA